MRNEQLLKHLATISEETFAKATHFASSPEFCGGWEVWLQAEIAYRLHIDEGATVLEREKPYPSGEAPLPYLQYQVNADPAARHTAVRQAAARCDFYLSRGKDQDPSYLELKCINPTAISPKNDAWARLRGDVIKIKALQTANKDLVCTAMLATYGIFQDADVSNVHGTLAWYWGGGNTAFVLDCGDRTVKELKDVKQDGVPRLFIVAISV